MPFQLLDASHSDMPAIISIVYAAYSDPYKPFVDLMLPGLDQSGPVSREEGMREASARLLHAWKARPVDHWLKVIDTETGEIVRYGGPRYFDPFLVPRPNAPKCYI